MSDCSAPTPTSQPYLVTIDEAAPLLRAHPVTLRAHLRTGELPGIKIGHRWFMSSQVLERLLAGERP
jgi:excisionase family DNA binding protein